MRNNIIIIVVIFLIVLVGSVTLHIYSQNKFEEKYGRKPKNVCEGTVSLGVIPMGYCDNLLNPKQRSNS